MMDSLHVSHSKAWNLLTYPQLVREFYGGLLRVSRGIETIVRGMRIALTKQHLAWIVHLHHQVVLDSLSVRQDGLQCIL